LIALNYRDPKPIYEQIKDQLRRLILTGALAEREKLPSVRELATQLAINPNTIQRAYRDLESEGTIYSLPGKGSFVAPKQRAAEDRRQKLLTDLEKLLEELKLTETDPNVVRGYVERTFGAKEEKDL